MKQIKLIIALLVLLTIAHQAQEIKFVTGNQEVIADIYLGGFENINSVTLLFKAYPKHIKVKGIYPGSSFGDLSYDINKPNKINAFFSTDRGMSWFSLKPIFNGQLARVVFDVDMAEVLNLNNYIDYDKTQITDLTKPYKIERGK